MHICKYIHRRSSRNRKRAIEGIKKDKRQSGKFWSHLVGKAIYKPINILFLINRKHKDTLVCVCDFGKKQK